MCGNCILEYFLQNVNIFTECFLYMKGDDILIYDKIKEICKSKGISVASVEKEAGLSNGTISKWKKSTPTHDRLEKLAGYFGVTSKYLMTGEYPTETE